MFINDEWLTVVKTEMPIVKIPQILTWYLHETFSGYIYIFPARSHIKY